LYIDLDNSSTTDKFYLPYNQSITFENCNFSTFSAICSTGLTTTLKIIGFGGRGGTKSNFEILKLNVTLSSSYVTFTNTTDYKDILIVNEGNKNAYIDFDNSASTTSSILLQPNEFFSIDETDVDNISAICSGSDTTTVKIIEVH